MVIYDSSLAYVQSATTIKAKIIKIDALITALEDTALKSIATSNIQEYSLNDGQTVIRTEYRNTKEVIKSIIDLEALRTMYVNRINGRMIRLVDGKNFI